ncbi:MAG: transporter substrate-binding domain-containing protein [Bacteroidetes bacterium]|jgi:two-component system, cell cycle sensor histidine kinase and response regulator CckA|nr:transporter substrate-binding domain-containing protein [Bacteroidota bacterium]
MDIGIKVNRVIILMGLIVFVLSGNALALGKITINLTPAEQAWLAAHPEITIAHSFDWPPYSFLDSNNKPVGTSIDFFELVAQIAGFKVKVHPDGLWNRIYEAGKNKQVDVVASMTITKEREELFFFPRPYLFLSSYIITRKDYQEIKHRDDLKGKRISGAKGTWQPDDVLKNYPSVTMTYVDTYSDALMAVSAGIVDATVITLGSALYDISQKGIYNLQLPAIYEKNTDLISFGVRNDWPELVSIIDKALAVISEEEKTKIINKWTPPLNQTNWSKILSWVSGISSIFILVIIVILNRSKFNLCDYVRY